MPRTTRTTMLVLPMVTVAASLMASLSGSAGSISVKLRCAAEALDRWVRQAQRNSSARRAIIDERRRIADLERENQELRRANAMLRRIPVLFE